MDSWISRVMCAGCLVAAAAGACQCEDDTAGLARRAARIEVEPQTLDFGEVIMGVRTRGVVTVRNAGDATLEIEQVTLQSPRSTFVVDEPPERYLPPASEAEIAIVARTWRRELSQDELRIGSTDPDRPAVVVTLVVRGIASPPCDDGDPCTADGYDSDAQECTNDPAPFEGARCVPEDPCVIDAVCSDGQCVGSTRSCDDGVACTVDYCRPDAERCANLPDDEVCDDDEACTIDRCTAAGCAHRLQLNGTPCDDGDGCTVRDTCFAGRCRGVRIGIGPDCEPADAGLYPDADPHDAGIDAGSYSDAEPAEVGTDAGVHPDAVVPDTGLHPDALVPDTGVHPDAAAPDMGLPPPGCSDDEREGFGDRFRFPSIAGCSGAWTIPGIHTHHPGTAPACPGLPTHDTVNPACSRGSGDDGLIPDGTGCNAADLCAAGWHVCTGAAEIAAKSPTGCAGATTSGDPPLFFASRQSSNGCAACTMGTTVGPQCDSAACRSGCLQTSATSNDVFGCGNYGTTVSSCGTCDRFSGNLCNGLTGPPWGCSAASAADNNGLCEQYTITKTGPSHGGVLCCRDPVP